MTGLVEERKHEKYHVEKRQQVRRSFIGVSDAQIIMGDGEFAWRGCGGRSGARSNRRISLGT
jgi:hypothetical protein